MLEFGQEIGKEGPCCEEVMDEIRAMVLCASKLKKFPNEVLVLIEETSIRIARDIRITGKVCGETLKEVKAAAENMRRQMGIGDSMVQFAHTRQIGIQEGFWWMRRYLGQFAEAKERMVDFGADQLIGLAMSGSPIAAYLQMEIQEKSVLTIPLSHIVFGREGKIPNKGIVMPGFELGKKVCLIEDVVNEPITLSVALEELRRHGEGASMMLFALELEHSPELDIVLQNFSEICVFEEW